jgi:organic radical activating enzyme
MQTYETAELMSTISLGDDPVVLFGAGDIGKLAHYALSQLGVAATAFCDGNEAKHGRFLRGIEILSPEGLDRIDRSAHVFICGNYLEPISALLAEKGFTNVYDCGNLLAGVDFTGADVGMDPLFLERKVALHQRECLKAREKHSDVLILKYLDVVVTEACSMKCQDCSNLMQYYLKPKHSDLDLLESAVDRIMQSIDRLYEFRVLGGEPFVNKNVHRVINKLLTYPHVDKIIVYTNATIVPTGANLDCLKHDKVVVDITDYGVHSKKLEPMLEVLQANGVNYLTKTPVWTDSGRIRYVERSTDELDDMFNNCCVNDVLTLLNGVLYRCPFSANGTNLHAIPRAEADIVDLTSEDPEQDLRSEVRRLYTKTSHLKACNFCNGRDYRTPRIEPAVQTRRPLPLLQVTHQ